MKLISAYNCTYEYSTGLKLIDCLSGTYHLPLGHKSSHELKALRRATHSRGPFNSYKEDDGSAALLGERLNEALDCQRDWKFLTTGSEAVERAVACAMHEGGTLAVVEGAFHGKSLGLLKAHYDTNSAWPYKTVVISWEQLTTLEDMPEFSTLLIEPVQGWTGRALTHKQMTAISQYCAQNNALIIADEVLNAFWRAGKPTYSAAMKPDILVVAKGMAGSIPISAVGLNRNFKGQPVVGWTATHANNSLANNIARELMPAVLDVGAAVVGDLEQLFKAEFPDDRITGALMYIRMDDTAEAVRKLREKGFIVADHNPYIRMAPAFTMPSATVTDLIEAIKEVRHEILGY